MFNLIFIFIVLDCQLVNTKNTILFPQNSFQIFQQQWVDCQNTSLIIQPQFDQPVRIPITYNKQLCLYEPFQFSLNEPMSFYYFTFDRTIQNDDLLIINIDGESYTVTQETAADKFVLIRHKRLCSYNSIEFQLLSKSKDLGLINYLILNSQTQSADDYNQVLREQQQLLQQKYLGIKEEYQITQYNLQTKNQEIINSTLYYEGVLSFQGLELISSCLYFDAYNFYDKMNCYNTEVGETIVFECNIDIARTESYSQMKNLSNLILSQYTFNFYTPCFEIPDQQMVFYTIQQISDSKFSIASYIQEKQFGMQHQINLNYELQINQLQNSIEIKLNLNQSQFCVKEFEEAVLTIKNSQGEIFKCELYNNNNNCLSYSYSKCSFIVNFDFKDDVGYICNLTAIIQRTDNNYPNFQFVLVDVDLRGGPVFQEQDYNFFFVAILIFLSLGMPIICFLISTSTIKISLYNSLLREIYNYEQNALKT